MPGKAFDPPHITILTGTTVTWRNGDSGNHTVTADADAFDSGYVAPGGSFSFLSRSRATTRTTAPSTSS